MVEGGGTLLGAMIEESLADKVFAFVAPKIIGGKAAPSPIGGKGITAIEAAAKLDGARIQRVGDDFLIIGYLVRNG